MKFLCLLLYTFFLAPFGSAQQLFDEFVKLKIKGDLQTMVDDGTTIYLVEHNGSLATFLAMDRPFNVGKVCTIADLKNCYKGSADAFEERGTVTNTEFITIDNYLAFQVDYLTDVPGRGQTEGTGLTLYFNKKLYNISFLCNSEDLKRGHEQVTRIIKSIRINDHNGQYTQLEPCPR